MQVMTEAGGLFSSTAQRLAAKAGTPSFTAFGVYMALEASLAGAVRPSALVLGFSGIVVTNGVARRVGRCLTARPSGTVTFLFTDIENSTALWETRPDEMRVALRHHDETLESIVRARHGTIFARAGDGFGAAFAQPDDAVDAALVAQETLENEPWPAGLPLRVRIGINRGKAEERDGDYFGPPVNRAARVMALAEPGTVLVTDVVAETLDPTRNVDLRYRGPKRLRGVGGVTHVYAADRRV